jgi:hypothetical protein
MSPLVLNFDPDRCYVQSVQKPVRAPLFSKPEMEKLLSIILSMFIRPKVMEALTAVVTERQEAWSEGSTYPPVADLSVEWACHFVVSLPEDAPDPEVGAGPKGDISFDWYDGRDHILTVGIQPDGTLHYAYVNGNERAHSTLDMEHGVPESLLKRIKSFSREELVDA